MRKIIYALIIGIAFQNCSDNVEFNSPAVQANKNGTTIWKANFLAADIDNGGFVIEGRNAGEKIQLITSNDARGTFNVGGDSDNVAIYVDSNGTVYSTKNTPDPSVSVYPASGEIIVDDIDSDSPMNVFGTFWFYAYTSDGLNVVNFNEGVFYKVPLVGGLVQID